MWNGHNEYRIWYFDTKQRCNFSGNCRISGIFMKSQLFRFSLPRKLPENPAPSKFHDRHVLKKDDRSPMCFVHVLCLPRESRHLGYWEIRSDYVTVSIQCILTVITVFNAQNARCLKFWWSSCRELAWMRKWTLDRNFHTQTHAHVPHIFCLPTSRSDCDLTRN